MTVENNGRLDAVFPLVWEKRFGIKALCNPGERFTDKSTLLLRNKDPELVQAIIKQLTQIGNFYLEELSADVAEMIVSFNKDLVKQKASVNPYLPLGSDPFRYMSSKNRSKVFNKVKKNQEDLRYKSFSADANSLETAFEIDKRSYKYDKGTSDLGREREREFYRQLLKENGKNFTVDIVYYKNLPIIYSIGFIHKKTYHAGITSYDKQYNFLSPGKILQYYLVKRLQEEKIEILDFSRGQSAFKSDFTHLSHIQFDILYAKSSWIRHWWKVADHMYGFIFETKILYGTYLIFKKMFLRR